MTKQFKNRVTASNFLAWYFSDSDMVEDMGNRVVESLMATGSCDLSARGLFDECGYIPQYICEDSKGDNEYDPSEVCFIQD